MINLSHQSIIRKSVRRRYGIGIITIFIAMKILPVRNNSQKIEAQIDKVQREIEEVEEKTNYTNNFQVKYLESEYAPYFAGHENGIIYDNEKVVRLSYQITKVDQSVPRKK